MTITLFLERISLFSALSAIVLAVFWPHVKPRVLQFFNFAKSIVYKAFWTGRNHQSEHSSKRIKLSNIANPKLSGKKLNRIVSPKEVMYYN